MKARRQQGPMWNEVDEPRDDRPRDVDEAVDQRMRRKRLKDCPLPDGFRLVTPEPRQFWLDGQLRYGFHLAWGRVGGQGRRGPDVWNQVFRYEENVPDEFQMQWAVEEFSRELEMAGEGVRSAAKPSTPNGYAPRPKIKVDFSLKVATQLAARRWIGGGLP